MQSTQRKAISAIVIVWLFAFLPANLVPSLIGRLVADFGLPVTAAGFIATGMTLLNAATVLAVRPLVKRGHRSQLAIIGGAVLLVISILGVLMPDATLISILLLIAGIGSGLTLAAASAAIAATPAPEKSATTAMVFNRLVVAVVYFLVPIIGTSIETIFLLLGAPALLVLATARWMPERPEADATPVVHTANAGKLAWILAVGMGLLAITDDGVIGVSEIIGIAFFGEGGSTLVLNLYAIATLAGLLGALIAAPLLRALGQVTSLSIAMLLSLGGKVALLVGESVPVFSAGYLVWGFAFGLCLPIIFGLAAALKRDGSASVAVNGVYVLGVALGPTVGAILLDFGGGETAILTFAMIGVAVFASAIMIGVAVRASRGTPVETQAEHELIHEH